MTADEINGIDHVDELEAIDRGLHFHTNFAPNSMAPPSARSGPGTKTAPDGPPPITGRTPSPVPAGTLNRRRPSSAGHRDHDAARTV